MTLGLAWARSESVSAVTVSTGRRRFALLAAVVMLLLSLKAPIVQMAMTGFENTVELVRGWMYYNISVLSANYLDVGFVRRGLGGTIARLLSADPYAGGFLFHVVSAVLLIAPLVLLQLRLLRNQNAQIASLFAIFIVLSPQTFLGWSNDIARTDMLVTAAIAWAALALLTNRPLIAAAILLIGSLVHETAVIFGIPLIIVLAASRVRQEPAAIRRHVVAFGMLVAALGLVASLQWLTGPDAATLAASMQQRTPVPANEWYADLRDCAIYMMVAGLRGVRTAICYNGYYQAYLLMVFLSVGVLFLNTLLLGLERKPLAVLLAVMLPTLFLDAVANDVGRWVKFATVNAWVLSLAFQSAGTLALSRWRVMLGFGLLALLLAMGSSRVHHTNPASEQVARWLGFSSAPQVGDWMSHCDPEWRDIARP
jgi:hypothetical protein